MQRESTWTAPRPDCPDPGRWSAPDAYAAETEISALVAAFVTALRPDLVVETGTHHGYTAEAIGAQLHDFGTGHLVTLEIDPDLAAAAARRCHGLPVTVLARNSLDWRPEQPIDFCWFDSDAHRRTDEFRAYRPFMHERSIVGFHDTGPQHPVRPLVQQLVADGLLAHPLYLPTPRGVCFARIGDYPW